MLLQLGDHDELSLVGCVAEFFLRQIYHSDTALYSTLVGQECWSAVQVVGVNFGSFRAFCLSSLLHYMPCNSVGCVVMAL